MHLTASLKYFRILFESKFANPVGWEDGFILQRMENIWYQKEYKNLKGSFKHSHIE